MTSTDSADYDYVAHYDRLNAEQSDEADYDYDTDDEEDENDDDDAPDPVSSAAPFDARITADEYQATTNDLKSAIWESLTPEQQKEVIAYGIAPPLAAEPIQESPGDGSEDLVPYDLIPIDHPDHDQTITYARRAAKALLSEIRGGSVAVDPKIAQELDAVVEAAKDYPNRHPVASENFQYAAALVANVRAAEASQGTPWVKQTHHNPNNGTVTVTGKSYTRTMTNDEWVASEQRKAEAEFARESQGPWGDDPSAVTVADTRGWSAAEHKKFRGLHPKIYEELLEQARRGAR